MASDFTVTVLPPGRRGRNKRGIAAHKPDKMRTKRAKRQGTTGNKPMLRTMGGQREP